MIQTFNTSQACLEKKGKQDVVVADIFIFDSQVSLYNKQSFYDV